MITVHDTAAVARRELRAILNDRWTRAALFVVPLIVGLLLALTYRGQIVRAIPTMVVDHDGTPLALAFRRTLAANESLSVLRTTETTGDVEGELRRGDIQCVVEIPAGFEAEVKQGKSGRVLASVNGTNVVIANYALRGLQTVAASFAAGIGIQKLEKKSPGAAHALQSYSPVTISSRLLYNPAQNYADFFIPGILAALLQQIVVVGAALTWVREFQTGAIRDLLATSGSLASIIAGKTLVYVTIGWAWALVYFAGLFTLTDVPFQGSPVAGALAVTLMLAGMTMFAMVISSLVGKTESAMPVVFVISSPAFLLSGYTFPQMAMSPVARAVGNLIPLTPFLIAWRRVVLYGAGIADILPQMLVMSAMVLVPLAVMVLIIRRKLAGVAAGGAGL